MGRPYKITKAENGHSHAKNSALSALVDHVENLRMPENTSGLEQETLGKDIELLKNAGQIFKLAEATLEIKLKALGYKKEESD